MGWILDAAIRVVKTQCPTFFRCFLKRKRALDIGDALSNVSAMTLNLTWKLVDDIATELGVRADARYKWRQRSVPPKWRISIAQELMRRGVPVALADFDHLATTPGRIAA